MEASRGRLLVVDDEVAQMQALRDTLREYGYDVVGCVDGVSALAALRRSSFDLLLADLMMPKMNGIELLRAALELDRTLVGIIMTGQGTIGTAVEAMQSGARDYILKPFKLSVILPILNRALQMRRLRLENAALERRVREHAQELEATNRELDAFTRSVSHDLRSPLGVVQGYARLLAGELGSAPLEEQRDWLARIQNSADHMSQLIDGLMRLSQVGRQALKLEDVDLNVLVQGAVEDLRQVPSQHPATVSIGALPSVVGDALLLRQVFVNLLSNAFKFTRDREPALIEVGSEGSGGERTFFVRDNGVGFDVAKAPRLFDAFQRFHATDRFEGSGVGLSIVQRIVSRHGGRIWAEATPAQGACFMFTLK
jgi:signal transduction histidine kinase